MSKKTKQQFKKLTPKEHELVELKAKGITSKDAYKKVYNVTPTTKDSTATSNTQKILNKPHVKNALQMALNKHDITLDNALQPISKGLRAIKQNEFTGEVTDDIALQLKASDRALKLLGVQNTEGTGQFHLHLHNARQKYDL